MQNKKRYRISFIVEQLYCQEVEAASKEEAYQIFCDGDGDCWQTDWSETQPDSYEVEEITDDN